MDIKIELDDNSEKEIIDIVRNTKVDLSFKDGGIIGHVYPFKNYTDEQIMNMIEEEFKITEIRKGE